MSEIIERAEFYALKCHRDSCHLYDGKPYEVHLQMVLEWAKRFIHLVPESDRAHVLAACWVHDVIEDCRQTYNDVKENTNESVAEIAYALTNEKGKNRKERANDKYYQGIRNTPQATFVKLCDRMANYFYSKENNNSMAAMYKKEMEEFCGKLYDSRYQEMFDLLLKD